MFLVSCLRNKLKIYSCPINLGTVYHDSSTWFKEFDEKFFFDKGALFTGISPKFRHILIFQFLVRHTEFLNKLSFFKAFKLMLAGSNEYIKLISKKNEEI